MPGSVGTRGLAARLADLVTNFVPELGKNYG
jgi:hypothetical protein